MMTARCFGYSDWEITARLRLPAPLPEIVTGVRIGAGVAVLATIAVEMLAGHLGRSLQLSPNASCGSQDVAAYL
jgi:ABC-type nitrate/sulfonate/bicarbonate transport system permease component